MDPIGADPGGTRVEHLWLVDFRCFATVDLELAEGLTVLRGDNGAGKTSLLEAVGWVARARSFRGVPDAALVRAGAERAVVRADVAEGARRQRFEAEIHPGGRNRVLLNQNAIARTRDLATLVRVSVFAPDDLELVKGGPAIRRAFLDDVLGSLAPRYAAARGDYERILRQRNALLRAGLRDPDAATTLDVFDEQLVRSGTELVRGRVQLLDRVVPALNDAYVALAGRDEPVQATYEAGWCDEPPDVESLDGVATALRTAIATHRRQEVDRGVSLVGPHRDEWRLRIGPRDARTHASQGEQRTLALAARLAGHRVVTDLTGTAPVLLLDDVFSELDPGRSRALVERLPPGQTLLTTAGAVPSVVQPQRIVHVVDGVIREDGA